MKNKLFAFIITAVCFLSVGNAYAQSSEVSEEKENIKTVQIIEVDENTDVKPLQSYVQEGYKGAKDTFDKMIVGYINKNLNQVLSTIADDKRVVFFGTGAKYILIGKDEIKKAFELDFNTIDNINIKVPWLYISGKDDVAWLSSIVELNLKMNGKETQVDARQTMVLEKVGDEWKIVNSHFSFPAMEEKAPPVEELEGTDEDVKDADEKMEEVEVEVDEEVEETR